MCCGNVFIFFFQAEDGIRDLTVTGVQTCALPILDQFYADLPFPFAEEPFPGVAMTARWSAERWIGYASTWSSTQALLRTRSEERREGKSVDLGGRRTMKKKESV